MLDMEGKIPVTRTMVLQRKTLRLKQPLKRSILEKLADFKVIYTRTTDVFIELANRPKDC
jgi:N-acetylmuramoyl-L-alanine amidase